MSTQTLTDKMPAYNPDAEAATLGALLIDQEAVSMVIQYLRSDDFFKEAHKKIFQGVVNISNKGEVIDLITITEELKGTGDLDACGGAAYISQLTSQVPTSANVEYYAKLVQECSIRRRLDKIASKIVRNVHDDSMEVPVIIEEAEKDIFDIVDSRHSGSYRPVKEIIPHTISAIEKLYHTKESYTGVPSGFPELDNITSGFQNSELIIIGARPSVGKTALALSIAGNVAIKYKKPVGFFTLEMSGQALVQRLVSTEARLDFSIIRRGLLKPSDFHNLTEAAGRIYDAPIYVEDTPNIRLLDLRALARRMKAKQQISIIFIDYLTLVTSENRNLQRHEQIAEISRSLKALARELDIPVVALSQVKREVQGGRPTLADIRESGSIEQDADVVMFLHRKMKVDRDSDENVNEIETEIIIAKQRNGPVGTVKVAFIPKYTKFESLSFDRG